MAIELQPATNPLDIPSPRPSEIVRNWPDAMWCSRVAKAVTMDGSIQFCSIGILNEIAGYDWGEPDETAVWRTWKGDSSSRAMEWFRERYGLSFEQAYQLANLNDRRGKGAAADYLESLGL